MADQLTDEQIAEYREIFALVAVRVLGKDVRALMSSVGCSVTDVDVQRIGMKDSDLITYPDFVKLIENWRKEQTMALANAASAEVPEADADAKIRLFIVHASGELVLEVCLEGSCLVSMLFEKVRQAQALLEKATKDADTISLASVSQPDFPDAEIDQFRQAFFEFCEAGHDAIHASDFGNAMCLIDESPTEAELQDIIAHFDAESSGFIDFPNFLSLLARKRDTGLWGENIGRRDRIFLLSPAAFRLVEEATLCQNGLKDGDTVTLAMVSHKNYAVYNHSDFTDAEMGEFRKAFNQLSEAGADAIHANELGYALRISGQNPSERELQDMIAELGAESSGFIDFPEFLSLNCRKMDIGSWGQHTDTVGVDILRGRSSTISDCHMIIKKIGKKPNPITCFLDCDHLGWKARNALICFADSKHTPGTHDLKVNLLFPQLEDIIGVEAATALVAIYSHRIDKIKIRRVQANGENNVINFHTDVSLRTMQVALNGEDQYEGGRLMYVTMYGLQQPSRQAGAVTIHDNTIPHGVSEMISGCRYGLLFITSDPKFADGGS